MSDTVKTLPITEDDRTLAAAIVDGHLPSLMARHRASDRRHVAAQKRRHPAL